MNYTTDKGYIIPAFNSDTVDYVTCAITLAKSLKKYHPDASICLLTNIEVNNSVFDYIKVIDVKGGFENDYLAYTHSPYHETIKLEADMIVTSPVDHWWTLFRNYDVWVSTGCKDYKGKTATSKHYRKIFTDNNLPDVYNAITYWRVSRLAKDFFAQVRILFDNWHVVQHTLKFAINEQPNTDVAYGLVIAQLGEENFTSPVGPQITHMKPKINNLSAPDWSKQLVWEIVDNQVRINGHTQHGFFHYHNKHLGKTFGEYYE